jgi:hypothetical protein
MEEQAGKDEPGAKLSEPGSKFIGGHSHLVNAAVERHPKKQKSGPLINITGGIALNNARIKRYVLQ